MSLRFETIDEPCLICYTTRRFDPVSCPTSDEAESDKNEDLYEVRIIDNDYNTYREVMDITMLALDVSEEQAYAVACDVDRLGFCVVAHANLAIAERIAAIIRMIGIEVQVNPIKSVDESH